MSDSTGSVRSVATTELVVVSALFPFLSLTSVLLRWKARTLNKGQWRSDDWWIVGTWIVTLGISINVWVFSYLLGINYYKTGALLGSIRAAQCVFVGNLLLQPSLAAVKISILLFYKRVFPLPTFARPCWVIIGMVSLWCVIFELLVMFQGKPISASWTGQGTSTFKAVPFSLAQAGTSLALDTLILCFPIPIICNLRLKNRQKIAVSMIFWMGGFCCVAAIVRLALLFDVLSKTGSTSAEAYDLLSNSYLLYIQSKAYIFTIAEPNCSIIAASLPCYGPLVRHWRGGTFESLLRSLRSTLCFAGHQSSNEVGETHPGAMEPNLDAAKLRSDSGLELSDIERGNRDGEPGQTWENNQGQGHSNVFVEHSTLVGPVVGNGIAVTRTFGTN